MSDFRWIAMALTVTAGCQVYDRVPWRRLRTWLWAKALALRSWVFRDELGDVLAREAGRELEYMELAVSPESQERLNAAARAAIDHAEARATKPRHRDGCAHSDVGTCSCPPPDHDDFVSVRKRGLRAGKKALAKRKKAKR